MRLQDRDVRAPLDLFHRTYHSLLRSSGEIQIQALAEHQSQGAADSEPWVRLRAKETAAEAGAEAGMDYAESFRAFSFSDDDESPLDEE